MENEIEKLDEVEVQDVGDQELEDVAGGVLAPAGDNNNCFC